MSRVRELLTLTFSCCLLAAVIASALGLIVVPKASDARPLTVLSGSMEPTYDIGDVVIVRSVDTDELVVGDVITFQAVSGEAGLTTHRIVGVTLGSEGRSFVTQGDNNDAPDPHPVLPEQVRGAVWYSVPLVGYVSVWVAGDLVGSMLDLIAFGFLVYGGCVIASAARDRWSLTAAASVKW